MVHVLPKAGSHNAPIEGAASIFAGDLRNFSRIATVLGYALVCRYNRFQAKDRHFSM